MKENPKAGHEAGRLLLAAGLKELYGLDMDEDVLESRLFYGEKGKPYLKDCGDIHFNISHCRRAAACAFSESRVGIDMESPRRITRVAARRIMTPDELDLINRHGTDERKYMELFLRLWTLKESMVKYDGSGITGDMCRIGFAINPYDIRQLPLCSRKGVCFWQGTVLKDCILSVCSGKSLHADDIDLRLLF